MESEKLTPTLSGTLLHFNQSLPQPHANESNPHACQVQTTSSDSPSTKKIPGHTLVEMPILKKIVFEGGISCFFLGAGLLVPWLAESMEK